MHWRVATAVRDDARAARPRGGADAGGGSGDKPLPRPPVDPGRAVAAWAPAERKRLAAFVAPVRARHGEVVQDVILDGSPAPGDWHDDSPIDVLIIVPTAAPNAARHSAISPTT